MLVQNRSGCATDQACSASCGGAAAPAAWPEAEGGHVGGGDAPGDGSTGCSVAPWQISIDVGWRANRDARMGRMESGPRTGEHPPGLIGALAPARRGVGPTRHQAHSASAGPRARRGGRPPGRRSGRRCAAPSASLSNSAAEVAGVEDLRHQAAVGQARRCRRGEGTGASPASIASTARRPTPIQCRYQAFFCSSLAEFCA